MSNTILLLEDENPLRLLYQEELKGQGYNVIAASNSEEALDMLLQNFVDIIVMDVKSSKERRNRLDYIDAFLQLQHNVRIVINSAYPDYKHDFKTWVADAFLTKSSDAAELKETVNRILASRTN